jgi:hypothetical protein
MSRPFLGRDARFSASGQRRRANAYARTKTHIFSRLVFSALRYSPRLIQPSLRLDASDVWLATSEERAIVPKIYHDLKADTNPAGACCIIMNNTTRSFGRAHAHQSRGLFNNPEAKICKHDSSFQRHLHASSLTA